ncbi:VOC family protein [Thermaerobacillus caldiproteolyticus]|uniref:Metallothiol transferase n=1 Tax=Thermaerobacillus caldiproteolyticus TaxID=247480 RepID=A0A7V9Z6W2_9BACL|nr:VOC family protein [Anoxybacillus caldiproteolyticus]MBA2875119.1 metallothiol transferase [Anoxybacillus caldiproteolyticus]QPA32916.1 VOC family protein [Anoxybacillus caldiproteolyticus]
MNVQGFSHVTINVSDLSRSLRFYVDVLHMKLVHRGRKDAYLEWGSAWVCLQERPEMERQRQQLGVDHVAFFIDEQDFAEAVQRLKENDVPIVREPVQRGRGWSVNFLDPDGTQLELHTSTLAERMTVWE